MGFLLELVLLLPGCVWKCGCFGVLVGPGVAFLNSEMPCEAIRLSGRFMVYHFVINK